MDDAEKVAARREILADVGEILRRELAADSWGRILIEIALAEDGALRVANIDVEEIFGDEAEIDALFGGQAAREVVPVLAKAVEALCALDGVLLEDVEGGTLVHHGDGRFAWLAALVHTPSAKLDAERDGLVRALRAKNDSLFERHGFPSDGQLGIDLARESVVFVPQGPSGVRGPVGGRATLLGTFVPASRTWGWGATNPHVPEAVRNASAELMDAIADREVWELSTPVFATDESTAWAFSALACDRCAADGVLCMPEDGGLVFVLVRDLSSV